LKEREKLRAEKKFQESDALRHQLEAEGYLVMDGPDGSSWTKK
jgi:cysteinyl-tRNA synthetase